MKTALVLALALAAGCTGPLARHAGRITMGTAAIMTTCDWGQTHSAALTGWAGHGEANPIMGPAPSTNVVNAYMAAAIVGTIVLGQILPERLRPYFYGAVTAVEVNTVVGNLSTTRGLCGLTGGDAH